MKIHGRAKLRLSRGRRFNPGSDGAARLSSPKSSPYLLARRLIALVVHARGVVVGIFLLGTLFGGRLIVEQFAQPIANDRRGDRAAVSELPGSSFVKGRESVLGCI